MDRIDAINLLRDCLKNNDTELDIGHLYTLSDLPNALPPLITTLLIEYLDPLQFPPLPLGLQTLILRALPLDHFSALPTGMKALVLVDEIEVWLGYLNQLKASLGLTSVTAEMRFFDVSGISASDLQVAKTQVKSAENSQFPTWILQWAPLHSLLQRTDSECWKARFEKKERDDENQYQALSDTELKPANLIGNIDAERTIGIRALESAEKHFFEGLRALTDQNVAGHLQNIWP